MNSTNKSFNVDGYYSTLYRIKEYSVLSRRLTERVFDFLIRRKHSRKDKQVKVSFRELKAQIYWPTTDQRVRGSNPCGRTKNSECDINDFSVNTSIVEIKFNKEYFFKESR